MLIAASTTELTDSLSTPNVFWTWPFVAILLAIALLPLNRRTHHWWEQNRNKLLVSVVLAAATLAYYGFRGHGIGGGHEPAAAEPAPASAPAPESAHATPAGWQTVVGVLRHAVLDEYIPFMVLLFSLYVIAGGIVIRGDIQATPLDNTTILAIGGILASLVGTTGASMMLIRLLLRTNMERRRVAHTIVFFIFIVSNVGGTLLPIGDPPLFLGYLRGVDFFWTLRLWKEWAFVLGALLAVYYVYDTWQYRHETAAAIREDRARIEPVQVHGMLNLVWVLGVVLAVALLDPSKPVPGTGWHAWPYLREGVQLAMAGLSLATTHASLRRDNKFNYTAIGEVACLFIGIFITMQVPIEILHARGPELGLTQPWQYFWATGVLSSFLDNAPTYVVFFETARTLPELHNGMLALVGGGHIREDLVVAISCGAVFMGANSYIGNGPNFMVKSIAEQAGVKMPSFFGYMAYAAVFLVPLFLAMTWVFFRP
ncbi:MAG: sodium:proton antiporter [Phycisphaerae bacterium]|jgi:Na+/H+ antiporter NhaD/arsenite permease-like protein